MSKGEWVISTIIVVLIIAACFCFTTVIEGQKQQIQHLAWCREEIVLNLQSIGQCIEDEQGTVEECLNTDWPEIQALYEKHGC
jgi:hypothetical protein